MVLPLLLCSFDDGRDNLPTFTAILSITAVRLVVSDEPSGVCDPRVSQLSV